MLQTTRWSMIIAARGDDPGSQAALAQLCATYRAPVLAFVRRRTRSLEEAEDLTQSFFVKFLEGQYQADADPARGRFRTFLWVALGRFLANAYDHATALKRGGGVNMTSLDADNGTDVAADEADSPEREFERAWAIAVLDRAMQRMREEAEQSGKLAMFARLHEFLGVSPEPARYDEVARELGMRRNTLAVTVHRLRDRLRELVRAELAETVSDHKELEAEMGLLRDALAGR